MHLLQQKIIDSLKTKTFDHMSLRQVGLVFGILHPQIIKHHLLQLEKKGLLNVKKHDRNLISIEPIVFSGQGDILSIPIVGYANCGPASLLAQENIEGYLKISKSMLSSKKNGQYYAIQAVGNSMNKANIGGKSIDDGDYVIVDAKQTSPSNNDYIVSSIEGLANIKKFFFDQKNCQILLVSESTTKIPPTFIHPDDDYLISGTVVQVIKSPSFS